MQNHHVQVLTLPFSLFLYMFLCCLFVFLLFRVWAYYLFGLLFTIDFVIVTEAFICEMTTRFPTSHLMDAMGTHLLFAILASRRCWRYWHLMLIKAHYYSKKLLELVKTSKASSPLAATKICSTILSTSALNM